MERVENGMLASQEWKVRSQIAASCAVAIPTDTLCSELLSFQNLSLVDRGFQAAEVASVGDDGEADSPRAAGVDGSNAAAAEAVVERIPVRVGMADSAAVWVAEAEEVAAAAVGGGIGDIPDSESAAAEPGNFVWVVVVVRDEWEVTGAVGRSALWRSRSFAVGGS